jgi:hypothetical protein
VTLFRRVDGIRDTTSSFRIDFADGAKPPGFQLGWPVLEPVRRYIAATQDEMLNWIKAGLAVKVAPDFEDPRPRLAAAPAGNPAPKALKVAKVELFYSKPLGKDHYLIPCAQLEVRPDNESTNAASFLLQCPIVDTEAK